MSALVQQRCLRHEERQAVARCPECRLFFCRECITEHDDRVLCAGCLRKKSQPEDEETLQKPALFRRLFAGLVRVALIGLFISIGWFVLISYGRLLLAIPTSFHDGTVWETVAGGLK